MYDYKHTTRVLIVIYHYIKKKSYLNYKPESNWVEFDSDYKFKFNLVINPKCTGLFFLIYYLKIN